MRIIFGYLVIVVMAGSLLAQDSFVARPGNGPSFNNEPTETHSFSEGLIFADNFNGDNSLAGLRLRGWTIVNQDGGGTSDPWFNPSANPPFPAYEGTNYVASSYEGANLFYIDHWLISPLVPVSIGDTITFWHRSPDNSSWDDSLYIHISPTGDTALSSFTVSSPRFLANKPGWGKYTFILPIRGNVRFAIQYQIFNGGPNGTHSDYIGIDDIQLRGAGIIPVELTSFSARAIGSTVLLNWATATETNNHGFEIQKRNAHGNFIAIGFVPGNGTTTSGAAYNFSDKQVPLGSYEYRLRQIDLDGFSGYSSIAEVNIVGGDNYFLQQNYPNPFNPSTLIHFNLTVDGNISLKVFNSLGQDVKTLYQGLMTAGLHSITFDAVNMPSGIYFVRLEVSGNDGTIFSSVKKMILSK